MQKKTQSEFLEEAIKKFGNKFDYSKVEYKNSQTKVCIICPEHGEFWAKPSVFLSSINGCPECSGLHKWNTEKFIEKAKEIHGDKYDYSLTHYVNKRTPVSIICPIHGVFKQNPHNHIFQKQGCPECGKKYAKEWRRGQYNDFIEESKKRFGDIYEFPEINTLYKNSHSKIRIKCRKCGNMFEKIACDHLTSPHGGCLKCYANTSAAETEIGEYVKSIVGPENVIFRDRKTLGNIELEIYIPKYKLAIEYNGLYWHSSEKKNKNYHLMKTEACESKGIRLIQVFEDEYVNHREIVLEKIKHILNLSCGKHIYGRKCDVSTISAAEAKDFLYINHIQGFSKATVYLGAFFNSELVSVMTFIKRKDEWELNRFASKIDYVVCGVAGKLLKNFIDGWDPKKIKSFADRRWTTTIKPNLYDRLGFKKEKILLPDYRYITVKNGKLVRAHKFGFRKSDLSRRFDLPLNLTESEMATSAGLMRIYDCGLIKYTWYKE